jgi:hypothetical protein
VLEREAAVAGNMVGVRVRLENRDELDVPALAFIQILLDRIRRIDEDGGSGTFIADKVRGTPQVVVNELLEEHACDGSNQCGYRSGSEVASLPANGAVLARPPAVVRTVVAVSVLVLLRPGRNF